jgi:hypothetical protein
MRCFGFKRFSDIQLENLTFRVMQGDCCCRIWNETQQGSRLPRRRTRTQAMRAIPKIRWRCWTSCSGKSFQNYQG